MQDSIIFYYKASKNKNRSLVQRQSDVNMSLHYAKMMGSDSLFLRILYQKTLLHYTQQQYDSLNIFGNLLKRLAAQVGNKYILGRYHYLRAYYFDEITHNPDSAFINYNLSKSHFQYIQDSSWVGNNLLSMGLIQQNQNDHYGSKETLTEAIQFLNSEEDIQFLSSCYNALATNHRKLMNYDDAIGYYYKAIETTDSKEDRLVYKNNLAATHSDFNQFEKAIGILKDIVHDTLLLKSPKEYARSMDNLAYAEWLNNTTTNAEAIFKEALEIRVKNDDKRGQIASYTHLGAFYSKTDIKKAISYFDLAIQLSKTLKIPKAEKDALTFLIQLTPKNIEFRDRYIFLQDSLYTQELKVKTQFAKYKYDDRLKLESILLLQKEKAEEQLDVARQRNQKTLALFGLALLLMIIVFMFIFYKQRNKRLLEQNKFAKLEATYETEAELSRKLHDDFGGKLNHTMMMVQNNTGKSIILDTLEGLYNQSRDFSREINEIDVNANFRNELLQMLRLHTPKTTRLILRGSKEIDWSLINRLTKVTLHKVLRELMINMTKYSMATAVNITFKKMPDIIQIQYSDNGMGATKAQLRNKNGLRNTEKRIRAIGGTIIFETEKGKGFKAQIKTPN